MNEENVDLNDDGNDATAHVDDDLIYAEALELEDVGDLAGDDGAVV